MGLPSLRMATSKVLNPGAGVGRLAKPSGVSETGSASMQSRNW